MVEVEIDVREASTNTRLRGLIERRVAKMDEVTHYSDNKEMFVGDLRIGHFVIERKHTTDILTKNDDGSLHLWNQKDRLLEMRALGFEICILVEGKYGKAWNRKPYKQRKVIQAQINGIENRLMFKDKIPIKKCDNAEEVVEWLKNLVKRAHNPNSESLKALRTHPRRNLSMDQKAEYILQGYRGIGPAKSRKCTTKWKNLKHMNENMINDEAGFFLELSKLIGKKYAKEFVEVNKYTKEE